MAQYKVLQDIEAEDKLLGPLSMRQFIYAAITIALGFVSFRLFTTSVWFLGFIFVAPALFFGLLSAPLGGQQSSEIWLLAKIRFFLMPRRRIWDQTGIQQLVTITAPKKAEKQLTKGYSQDEVKSRLKTLATTLDTRGWAVKNATAPIYGGVMQESDRLLDIESAPDSDSTPDILDPENNPRSQRMDAMIQQSSLKHRQAIESNIAKVKAQQSAIVNSQTVIQAASADEDQLLAQLKAQQSLPDPNQNLKTLQPASMVPQPQQIRQQNSVQQAPQSVTATPNPAILNIVKNSENLSVQTIAGQANRAKAKLDDGEVVISLH